MKAHRIKNQLRVITKRGLIRLLIFPVGWLLIVIGCNPASSKQPAVNADQTLFLFVGTYTNTKPPAPEPSKGIYLFQMHPHTGKLNYVTSTKAINPTYLAIHPNKKWLYSLNQFSDTASEGALSAYQIDTAKKQLILLNTVSSRGKNPCYIWVDLTGKFVLAANYGSGNVTVCPINTDGTLREASSVDQHLGKGPNKDRQEGPHAHMITQGSDKRFVYGVDLGIDKVIVYELDTINGILRDTHQDVTTLPGAGPRHLAFHPNHRWAYLIHELNGTVEGYTIDPNTGALTGFQNIPTSEPGMSSEARSADIHVSPNGKFLYASNRGKVNSIAMYKIDQASGMLQLIGFHHARINWPRAFMIDPSGTFLLVANQNGNTVITLMIDPATGKLIETGLEENIPSPVCLKFY